LQQHSGFCFEYIDMVDRATMQDLFVRERFDVTVHQAQIGVPYRPATIRSRVCLLCLSVVKDDPRVRKQGNLLHRDGHEVVAVGLLGGTAPNPDWPICGLPAPDGASEARRIYKLLSEPRRYATHFFCKALQPLARWSSAISSRVYWGYDTYRKLFEIASGIVADVYVANDWNMLPIAHRLASMHGSRFVYDSHEYAVEELPENLIWRIFGRPLAMMVERTHIHQASLVSTVSTGIAEHLKRDHRLREVPLVVRNVPERQPSHRSLSPLGRGGDLTLLFHGAITEHRGIHVLVASVSYWRSGRRLILRGPISDTYRRRLDDIVERYRLQSQVTILPPVPADQLITAATEADIGIVCLPDTSLENRFALPNKVFEYIIAGLALLVPRLDELQAIVTRYHNGVAFSGLQPAAIAEVVNDLNLTAVDAFKANSRLAATELVWEKEAAGWRDRLCGLAVPR
jgi:glycosyltransferase involved in cell wall biosynthesis